jgi:uncharacterized protein (TIGR00255 family)
MKSMTGFGRGSAKGDEFEVYIDLKTVNNRFLDINLRAGAELSAIEVQIRKQISARLSRGRVDINITLDRTGEVDYLLNRPLIAGFISAFRAIQKEFNLTGEPDINALARLPGVMQPKRDGMGENIIAGIEQALDQAITALDAMRLNEGSALAKEMHSRLDTIEKYVPIIEAASSEMVGNYRARLHKRISELMARDGLDTMELDQSRLSQEVAYLADRSDISEELTRLRSHLNQFRSSIDEEGELGKKLDFLLQELNREANTILSKTSDFSIKEAALAIKVEIEKLREQVQNIE